MIRLIFFLALAIGLSSCALLNRSLQSGYSNDSGFNRRASQEYFANKSVHDESLVRNELGISTQKTLDEVEAVRVLQRLNLANLEKSLTVPKERKAYFALKPFFRSDAERIEYLSLSSQEARDRFSSYRNIDSTEAQYDPGYGQVVEEGDVGLGMTKKAVRESWGDPDFVDVAGDPLYGNERWKYIKYLSTEDGYRQEQRLIYFEAGRVAGWEVQR